MSNQSGSSRALTLATISYVTLRAWFLLPCQCLCNPTTLRENYESELESRWDEVEFFNEHLCNKQETKKTKSEWDNLEQDCYALTAGQDLIVTDATDGKFSTGYHGYFP